MTDYPSLRKRIDQDAIEFVDLRAVDLIGRFRHVTVPAARFTEDLVERGVGFDASNYGLRSVASSDMVLLPDLATTYVEDHEDGPILVVIGDVVDAATRQPTGVDPRGVAHRAEAYLRESGIADTAQVSPEFEFYVFEQAYFDSITGRTWAEVVPFEGLEHRKGRAMGPVVSTGYHAPLPQDRLFALRNDMVRHIEAAGIPVKYHHHEVGVYGQVEIELGFAPLLRMADVALVVKSLVRNTAYGADLSATFLPKPLFGQAGSGLHLHQYLVKDDRNLFAAGDGLSETALCYIGGLLTHGPSLMALTNPSTNSYRRLVPGFEAPVYLVFGAANRSAAVRVPAYARADDRRVELRTMDATANPYLAFAAILMAGLDGVRRDLNAVRLGLGPFEADAFDATHPGTITPRSLDQALDALEEDHDYLTAGGVFDAGQLAHWVAVKREEALAVSAHPHPHEFVLYYEL